MLQGGGKKGVLLLWEASWWAEPNSVEQWGLTSVGTKVKVERHLGTLINCPFVIYSAVDIPSLLFAYPLVTGSYPYLPCVHDERHP